MVFGLSFKEKLRKLERKAEKAKIVSLKKAAKFKKLAEEEAKLAAARKKLQESKSIKLTKNQLQLLKDKEKQKRKQREKIKKAFKTTAKAIVKGTKFIDKQINKIDTDRGLGIKKPRKKAKRRGTKRKKKR